MFSAFPVTSALIVYIHANNCTGETRTLYYIHEQRFFTVSFRFFFPACVSTYFTGMYQLDFSAEKCGEKNKEIIADMTNREDRRKMWSVPNRRRLPPVSAAKTLFTTVPFSVQAATGKRAGTIAVRHRQTVTMTRRENDYKRAAVLYNS